MAEVVLTLEQKRAIILFQFFKNTSPNIAHNEINEVFKSNIVSRATVYRFYKQFKQGNYVVVNSSKSNRRLKHNLNSVREEVLKNPEQSQESISVNTGIPLTTVKRYLKNINAKLVSIKRIPHELTDAQKAARVNVCSELLAWYSIEDFLSRIITQDETYILYFTPKKGKFWRIRGGKIPKEISGKNYVRKVMLCVWWSTNGVEHFELYKPKFINGKPQGLNAKEYSNQIKRLHEKLSIYRPRLVNRDGVIYHHDNARIHTAETVKKTLRELNYQLMPHPPYSPDIAPCDYHLFRGLKTFLRGKKFDNLEQIENVLNQYFMSKNRSFYNRGIRKLVKRWEEVVESNGEYVH